MAYRKAEAALGQTEGLVGRFDATRRCLHDRSVGAREEEPLVPVGPTDQKWGRPVGSADLNDLAPAATLTYALAANFDVISP